MLSERERHELETIERELSFDDPALAASFRRGSAGRFRSRFVRPRSPIVVGVVVMMAAIVFGLAETFMQGLMLTSAGATWWLWATRS